MKPKKSFISYYDNLKIWEGLTDSQAGKLIKIIHQNGKHLPIKDPLIAYAYGILKEQIDVDYVKWLKTCEERRKAAHKRWDKTDANAFN